MNTIQVILDTAMCILWITTYSLVLIGTIRYRYPLISPITQAIIAPLEFSVLFLFVKLDAFRFDYASVAYLYWSIIEIVIIAVIIKKGYIQRKWVLPYIGLIMAITGIMIWLVTIKESMFLFNYVNTFSGIFVWWIYVIRRQDYPMKPISLAVFIMKFIADVLAFLVYFGDGDWLSSFLCVMLPVVDFMFLPLYFKRRKIHLI